jgi:hypothetical protein
MNSKGATGNRAFAWLLSNLDQPMPSVLSLIAACFIPISTSPHLNRA